jgi:hypothetical protein
MRGFCIPVATVEAYPLVDLDPAARHRHGPATMPPLLPQRPPCPAPILQREARYYADRTAFVKYLVPCISLESIRNHLLL